MNRFICFALALACSVPAVGAGEVEQAVRPGDRLDISNYAGEINIGIWDRDHVRVVAEMRGQEELKLERRGSVIRVRTASWDEPSDSLAIYDDERAVLRLDGKQALPGPVVYSVTLPAWLPVTVGGAQTDVSLEGLAAPVEITLFHGEVRIRDVRGDVTVRALGGRVDVAGAEGSLVVRGWQGSATFRRTSGDLVVETLSGDIEIEDHLGGSVQALTVSGDLAYRGALPRQGTVSLASHDGDLDLALPADADAVVRVRRVRGTFETDFPVPVPDETKSFGFQLGGGRVVLDLESFAGTIRLKQR